MAHPSIHVRLQYELLSALNAFRRDEPDLPTIPKAVCRLLKRALAARAAEAEKRDGAEA